ncbi:MAG TPA: tRNA (adenosine(37)-N6)-dimethylallyltransferase MiaA [Candidatus Limiplasma sp.]|nr:tRNA (adenosine(37)-N6)-dimethylallyltransferase MiaA [Candidatus Limiplasma sp.]HPS81061.1 tRNA (adenosine(37)-N6)-dimethylallyltransferase MiaA [Candidatus Limiplasma sp.]
MQKTPVLCIVGPTASGKTALAVQVAQALGGEIISMDSMQIYRRMDIGTAKPTLEERGNIPHHLIDILEPTEPFTVAEYAAQAEAEIQAVNARGSLPILAGGTGFYLRALTDGLSLGGVKSDPALRDSLRRIAAEPGGIRRLHDRLRAVDPISAEKLHENDVQRVSRALEVFELTGKPFSAQEQVMADRPFQFCLLGATMERALLYQRVNERVDRMLRQGLLREIQSLLDAGVPAQAQSMQGIGYKELTPALLKRVPLSDAVTALKQNTRHYAKRQWTWFRANPEVQWLDMTQPESVQQALRVAGAFWKEANA